MYKLTLALTNPITGDSQATTYQFDPDTFDVAAWTAGFPAVKEMLDSLAVRSTAAEPVRWADAASAISTKPPV